MSLPKLKQDATDAMLLQAKTPAGGAWATAARDAALARVATMGVPLRREEYWSFTDPSAWTSEDATFTTKSSRSDVFDGVNPLTLVFVDGVFDADASDDLSLDGVSIELLSDVTAVDLHWAKSVFGVLEANANTAERRKGAAMFKPVHRPLAALNTGLAEQGVVIHATGQVSRPIRLSYVSNGGQALMHHVIKVDEGAQVTILEEGLAGARYDILSEVDVADTGAFNHLRINGGVDDAEAMNQLYGRLGRESAFKSFTLSVDGVMTRNEAVLELTGDDASAHVAGACLGDGKFHHDDTVYVTHDAVNCESRQVFKKVLSNGATGVFQGKILVQPEAQKTDGYQISQSLLLDDDSQFLAKPELEIYADDVACSHGSTSGAIDEGALFYLRSRGVPMDKATDLLVLSFLAEAIEEIENDDLADAVLDRLQIWLEARRG